MWDIEGDAFDLMNEGMLEFSDQSLDEPDLDGVICNDDNED